MLCNLHIHLHVVQYSVNKYFKHGDHLLFFFLSLFFFLRAQEKHKKGSLSLNPVVFRICIEQKKETFAAS